MSIKTNFEHILLFISLSCFLIFLGCKRIPATQSETLHYPPFHIEKTNVTAKQYKPNEGTMSEITRTKYKIMYKDQLITFPDALDANADVSGIWKTYFLADAPVPALLVASKYVYIVTEENQSPLITPIANNFSNYASIQWLDADNGQPGPKTQILIGEDSTDCVLKGGNFLLINETTVVRMKDLELFHFIHNTDLSEGYTAYQVVGFSPDHSQIVFMGSKSDELTPTQFIHALIVYDFQTNEAYTLPFDKTQMRLHLPYKADVHWMNTYFNWQPIDSSQYRLIQKEISQPPGWEGYYTENSSYELAPVSKEMHATLARFIIEHLQLEQDAVEAKAFGNLEKFTITYQNIVLDISYVNELNTVSVSSSFMNKGNEESAQALIHEIGDAFNEILRKGDYQSLFTSY